MYECRTWLMEFLPLSRSYRISSNQADFIRRSKRRNSSMLLRNNAKLSKIMRLFRINRLHRSVLVQYRGDKSHRSKGVRPKGSKRRSLDEARRNRRTKRTETFLPLSNTILYRISLFLSFQKQTFISELFVRSRNP